MKIIVACEESQEVCKAFRKKGHEAYSCDILDCSGGHPEWHIKTDILNIIMVDNDWDMMIAHPVCTTLTNAGVKWLHMPSKKQTVVERWREFFKACEFYKVFQNSKIPKKAIENPVMHRHANEILGPIKRHFVQPWWFGEKAFKATGFELTGLKPLTPTNKLIPPKKGTKEHKEWSFIHRMSPGPERSKLRSKTFPGIAKAMAEQWGGENTQIQLELF